MRRANRPMGDIVMATFLGVIALPPAVLGAFAILVWHLPHRACVQLENGLNLGYEARFDVNSFLFEPIIVPRFANGTPLVRRDIWPVYVTATTLYGVVDPDDNDFWYSNLFAWRADTGLVFARDDSALYERLVAEAGPANWDLGPGNFSTGILFQYLDEELDLDKEPGVRRGPCPTAYITW